MVKLLNKAVRLAAKVHIDQVDRFEQPYILHVLRVMVRGRDLDEQLLGALHDVLERSDLTVENLREKGYPENVLEALTHITRIEPEDYETYIDRVSKNSLAIRVKVHDLSDKMDLRNVGALNEADLKRYNKQMEAYQRLVHLESIVRAQLTLQAKTAAHTVRGVAKAK
ncbi:MAG: phosphohydrolase [Flavobacteriales bacterium]|nr:phosphohydrolase [Flavobacteriales bacterium]MBL0043061.1 phosphohydrolase [Flavobacteriales bacterium]